MLYDLGNNCRIVYFGLNGDPRTPKDVNVDGVCFEGSDGHSPRNRMKKGNQGMIRSFAVK